MLVGMENELNILLGSISSISAFLRSGISLFRLCRRRPNLLISYFNPSLGSLCSVLRLVVVGIHKKLISFFSPQVQVLGVIKAV